MGSRKTLDEVETAPLGGRVVGVGVFDGVHLGHQRIISEVVAEASARSALPTVVTFYPHPEEVLGAGPGPGMLTPPGSQARLLGALGVKEVVTVPFDREFSRLLPEEFCELVLSARLGARAVFVGENFRFGRDGSGGLHDLQAFGQGHGFAVNAVGLLMAGGEVVSSTRIRGLLREGRVADAAGLLGRPHSLEGNVVRGAGRGLSLGAPTANLATPHGLIVPKEGVYATRTTLQGSDALYESVTSIGTNPTFQESGAIHVETLVVGFEGDLYGSDMRVEFLERLRGQARFEDRESLSRQIREDVKAALAVHVRLRDESTS